MNTEVQFWTIPYRQAALTYASFITLALIAKLGLILGMDWISERFPWILAASFLLLFGIFNALVLLTVNDNGKYWTQSMLSYALFAILGGLSAMLLSGIALGQAGSFRWIYLVISFSYLVFLSIGGMMKIIVGLAQRADTRNFENRRYKHKK